MEETRVCRRCLLLESGRGDTLAEIQKRIEALPAAERTPRVQYEARLAVCAACEALVGGTCLKCGCYPEFRAAFRRQGCPIRRWPQ